MTAHTAKIKSMLLIDSIKKKQAGSMELLDYNQNLKILCKCIIFFKKDKRSPK